MATIKVALRKRKNAQGLHPIIIRIRKNRKASIITTGQAIEEKHWDASTQKVKKSHPNSARLNHYILKKLAEANDKLLELESDQKQTTAQLITSNIKEKRKISTFFELANIYLKQLETQGQLNRLNSEKPRIKHFKNFLHHKDISFPEINEVLLNQFRGYLKTERGNSDRSVVNSLIVIRTIFNLAIREGIVDRKFYPFGKGGITIRFPQSVKIGLSAEEVKVLESVSLEDEKQIHARNVWLFSFYFAGMRISDVLHLKWSDFNEGRLYYQMGKNSKVLSLKIPDQASRILSQYETDKRSEDDFIFPELKKADLNNARDMRNKTKNGNKKINEQLRKVAETIGLTKPFTMHIARHTFGNISGDRIPFQVLQVLYRHSDITTTINYQNNFAHKQVDDALDKVLKL